MNLGIPDHLNSETRLLLPRLAPYSVQVDELHKLSLRLHLDLKNKGRTMNPLHWVGSPEYLSRRAMSGEAQWMCDTGATNGAISAVVSWASLVFIRASCCWCSPTQHGSLGSLNPVANPSIPAASKYSVRDSCRLKCFILAIQKTQSKNWSENTSKVPVMTKQTRIDKSKNITQETRIKN